MNTSDDYFNEPSSSNSPHLVDRRMKNLNLLFEKELEAVSTQVPVPICVLTWNANAQVETIENIRKNLFCGDLWGENAASTSANPQATTPTTPLPTSSNVTVTRSRTSTGDSTSYPEDMRGFHATLSLPDSDDDSDYEETPSAIAAAAEKAAAAAVVEAGVKEAVELGLLSDDEDSPLPPGALRSSHHNGNDKIETESPLGLPSPSDPDSSARRMEAIEAVQERAAKSVVGLCPQLISVGIQEMVELTTSSVLGNTVAGQQTAERAVMWHDNLLAVLREKDPTFQTVATTHMLGLAIFVFSTSTVRRQLHNIQVANLPRGVGGVLGNKGAVYVRFDLHDSSVCLVNAHFAAHMNQVEKRNADYHAILRHPAFPDYLSTVLTSLPTANPNEKDVALNSLRADLASLNKKLGKLSKRMADAEDGTELNGGAGNGASGNSSAVVSSGIVGGYVSGNANPAVNAGSTGVSGFHEANSDAHVNLTQENAASVNNLTPNHARHQSADDHDIIIWFGDLNYRIHSEIGLERVYQEMADRQLAHLFSVDQLYLERISERVFHNFVEMRPRFLPTYQFIVGTDLYDRRKDKKMRVPAWCDRVLVRIKPNCGAGQMFDFEHDNEEDDEALLLSSPSVAGGRASPWAASSVDSSDLYFSRVLEYCSLNGLISDHKPVRCCIDLRVKCVDWGAYEQRMIDLCSPALVDVSSNHPLELFSVPWHKVEPEVLECSLGGDLFFVIHNLSRYHSATVNFDPTSVPDWIRLLDGLKVVVEPAYQSAVSVRILESKAQEKANALQEEYIGYGSETLPHMGRLLQLPSKEGVTLSALIRGTIKWLSTDGMETCTEVIMPLVYTTH